jgi:hypothetical protein
MSVEDTLAEITAEIANLEKQRTDIAEVCKEFYEFVKSEMLFIDIRTFSSLYMQVIEKLSMYVSFMERIESLTTDILTQQPSQQQMQQQPTQPKPTLFSRLRGSISSATETIQGGKHKEESESIISTGKNLIINLHKDMEQYYYHRSLIGYQDNKALVMTKICEKCGITNRPDAIHCSKCGTKLPVSASVEDETILKEKTIGYSPTSREAFLEEMYITYYANQISQIRLFCDSVIQHEKKDKDRIRIDMFRFMSGMEESQR